MMIVEVLHNLLSVTKHPSCSPAYAGWHPQNDQITEVPACP